MEWVRLVLGWVHKRPVGSMYCCCTAGCDLLGVKRCTATVTPSFSSCPPATAVDTQDTMVLTTAPSPTPVPALPQESPVTAPPRRKRHSLRRSSSKRGAGAEDKYDNGECLVIVRAASNSSLQSSQQSTAACEYSDSARTSLCLTPGYEQYQMSLLEVPWSADYGEASSDDLSSEWDSDIAEPAPDEQASVKVDRSTSNSQSSTA